MNLKEFCRIANVLQVDELEKVRLLAFFYQKTSAQKEFSTSNIREWFEELDLPQLNNSRLLKKIRGSRAFIKGKGASSFKLHAAEFDGLQAEYPGIHVDSEDVASEDTILPLPLYENTRGFIESLAKQINASYEFNIFDGCAVLMRRLLEILLILTYEHLNIEAELQDTNDNYVSLEKIIANAKSNKKLKLSRDSKSVLGEFRALGNFSAHKIYYNCRRADLKKVASNYRATIEELLYKCGVRK